MIDVSSSSPLASVTGDSSLKSWARVVMKSNSSVVDSALPFVESITMVV